MSGKFNTQISHTGPTSGWPTSSSLKSRWTEGVLPIGSNSWWNGSAFRRRLILHGLHWCGLSISSIFIVTGKDLQIN